MKLDIPEKVRVDRDKLFKKTAYDIRAYVGEPGHFFEDDAVMTPDAMKTAGALMGSLAFERRGGGSVELNPGDAVVVGYDNGPTSPALAEAFTEGLLSQGVNVYSIGISSSGQVYQNQEQLGARGHCQITRSHVEVTTNGAKFGIGPQGIHTYLLQKMNEVVEKGSESRQTAPGKKIDKTEEGKKVYFDKMKRIYGSYFSARDNSLVAVNVFGGTGVKYADLFREIFGPRSVVLGTDLNVNAGDLLADPTRKEMLVRVPGLEEILKRGKRVHSFDLDADRGSLTEGEEALSLTGAGHYLGDDLSFILAEHKIKFAVPRLEVRLRELGLDDAKTAEIIASAKTVYVDPRYTSSVKSHVDSVLGGTTAFHRKGHSLWKETMTERMEKMTSLAGFSTVRDFVKATGYRDIQIEASLHMFATDTEDGMPRDDAVENVFLLETIMDDLNIKSLAEYFSRMPRRFITKEIRTTCVSNEAKDVITANIVEKIRRLFEEKPDVSIVEFDGQIRADWNTGFIMYGMSNTSPKLTFMAEGSTPEERNGALAFILALHNDARSAAGDTLPMDLDENRFFLEDASYAMTRPDDIDFTEPRAERFMSGFGLA